MVGVRRRDEVLGLHPKACGSCPAQGLRVVSRRRWTFSLLVPLLVFEADWTTCTSCGRTRAFPRVAVPTAATLTLVLAALMGLGVLGAFLLPAIAALAMLWFVALVGALLAGRREGRLIPIPAHLRPGYVQPGLVRRTAGRLLGARLP